MNTVCLNGRVANPKFYPGKDGKASVLKFTVCDRKRKSKAFIKEGERDTNYWNCILFGKQADVLAGMMTKGRIVTVSGEMDQEDYTDKQGAQKTSTNIKVAVLELGPENWTNHAPEHAEGTQVLAPDAWPEEAPKKKYDTPWVPKEEWLAKKRAAEGRAPAPADDNPLPASWGDDNEPAPF